MMRKEKGEGIHTEGRYVLEYLPRGDWSKQLVGLFASAWGQSPGAVGSKDPISTPPSSHWERGFYFPRNLLSRWTGCDVMCRVQR